MCAPETSIPTDPAAARAELAHELFELELLIDRLHGAVCATDALAESALSHTPAAQRSPDETGLRHCADQAYSAAFELRELYHLRLHPLAVAAGLKGENPRRV